MRRLLVYVTVIMVFSGLINYSLINHKLLKVGFNFDIFTRISDWTIFTSYFKGHIFKGRNNMHFNCMKTSAAPNPNKLHIQLNFDNSNTDISNTICQSDL